MITGYSAILPLSPGRLTITAVNIEDVVANLSAAGLPAEVISLAVPDVDAAQIRTILSVRRKIQSPAQQALTDEVRGLARLAVRKAATIMEFGPPDHRLQIIRTVLANAAKLVVTEEDTTTEELRAELTDLYREMRDVKPAPEVITESFIDVTATTKQEDEPHAAEIATPPSPTYYQDDEHGVPQAGFELR